MKQIVFISFAVCLILLQTFSTWQVAEAQTSDVRKASLQNQAGVAYIEDRGTLRLEAGDQTYEKRYVLRYPEKTDHWNRKVLVAAHGGSGGKLYTRDGQVIDTSEMAVTEIVDAVVEALQ